LQEIEPNLAAACAILEEDGILPLHSASSQHMACGGVYFVPHLLKKLEPIPVQDGMFYGITFSFDNLNHNMVPHNFGAGTKVRTMNMTSAFAVYNRIPIEKKYMESPYKRRDVTSLSINTWFITAEEWSLIENSHMMVIRQVLFKYLTGFSNLRKDVICHPTHEHSRMSSKPSRFVR